MEHTNAEQTQQCEVVEEQPKSWLPFPTIPSNTMHLLELSLRKSGLFNDFFTYLDGKNSLSDTLDTNHPDYMRLVVHSMD